MDKQGEKRAAQKAARHARVQASLASMSEEDRNKIILARRKYAMDWYRRNPEKVKVCAKRTKSRSKTDITFWAKVKVARTKARCKSRKIEFDLDYKYVLSLLPQDMICPISKRKMKIDGGKTDGDCVSLDRINPKLGYIKGNVAVMSRKANTIKQDETDPELFRRLADWLASHQSHSLPP